MSEGIVLIKKALRKKIKLLKSEMGESDKKTRAEAVMKKLECSSEFKNAKTIFIYWAMDDEIDTKYFILKWAERKKFILPAINGDELHLKEFTGVHKLKNGDLYSIPEPDGTPFHDLGSIDLAIVPGIAFDRHNNRMGRGKAYYDKILSKLKGTSHLIGICYDFQMVENVPVEPHDIKMDGVIYG
ncbi:TPA: 5-formyltetrahydrofolate cyclo-ligase [Candidatus Delongbacteria bacterium]|nr:5-formyltetrahydrofolate cyclo-ligase [Candidatus Delongbacteria bacterium]